MHDVHRRLQGRMLIRGEDAHQGLVCLAIVAESTMDSRHSRGTQGAPLGRGCLVGALEDEIIGDLVLAQIIAWIVSRSVGASDVRIRAVVSTLAEPGFETCVGVLSARL